MGELQGPHQPLMQVLGMLAGAEDPTPHGGFGRVQDPRRRVGTQAFGDGVQNLGDAGLRCFETVERSVPACRKLPGTARQGRCTMASLAVEILDGITPALAPRWRAAQVCWPWWPYLTRAWVAGAVMV